jgi:hypothetical protein
MHPVASVSGWIASTSLATVAFWSVFGACVDAPLPNDEPQARVVAAWDPLQCGEPHRVVIELEDDAGIPLASSAPCALGELTLDAPRLGRYRGQIYAWTLDDKVRSMTAVDLSVDAPVMRWVVPTPR